jgi:flagellar basal-body rod modification protein FlgD
MNINNTIGQQSLAAKSKTIVGTLDDNSSVGKSTRNLTKSSTTGKDELGKDAFLKILVTQLKHQNPLEPMKDQEFIAQLATFNSLEQMINMNKKLEMLVVSQNSSQLLQFNEMIGKKVSFETVSDKQDDKGNFITEKGEGTVKSVHYKGTEVLIELTDGKQINAFHITSVSAP